VFGLIKEGRDSENKRMSGVRSVVGVWVRLVFPFRQLVREED